MDASCERAISEMLLRRNQDGPWKRQFELETKRTSICEKNIKNKRGFEVRMAPNVYRFRSSTDLMERDFKGKFSSLERFRNGELKTGQKKEKTCNKVHFENEDENEDENNIPDLKTWISRLKQGEEWLKFLPKTGGKFDKSEKPSIFTQIGLSVPPKMSSSLSPASYKIKDINTLSHQNNMKKGKISHLPRYSKLISKTMKEDREKSLSRPMTGIDAFDMVRPRTSGFVKFGQVLERSEFGSENEKKGSCLAPNQYAGDILENRTSGLIDFERQNLPRFKVKRGLTNDIGFYELQKRPVYYRAMSRIK